MTLRHLQIFLTVCETNNMTKAAEKLYMTQPAVTRAIKELEQHYGIILFERFNHRLSLTAEGKKMYERAVHVLEQFDLMEKEALNPDGIQEVRLGASITLGNFFMPDLISELNKRNPGVRYYVRIGRGESIVELLRENKIDVGFVETAIEAEDLISKKISDNEMVLITHPKHPLTRKKKVRLQDIKEYPLLLRQDGSVGREYVNSTFTSHELDIRPLWESASTQALVRAVAKDIGVAILPYKLVRNAEGRKEIVVRKFDDIRMIRSNNVIYHKNKYLSPLLKEVIVASEELAKEL